MKLLLVRPPDPLQDVALLSHTRPMNLAYLAGYVREAGFDVVLADYEIEPYTDAGFAALLEEHKLAVVGVSCMTPTIRNGARICAAAKAFDSRIVTVVGGSHANGLPVGTMREFPSFDYLVQGEGEETLRELCTAIRDGGEVGGIKGLVCRCGETIVQNPPRPLIEDIDTIPFPARDLIRYDQQAGHFTRGFSNVIPSTEFFTSRGCPVGCTFCAIKATFGTEVRFRNLVCIEDEVEHIVKHYPFRHLVIADDTFTLKKDRAIEMCDIFRKHGIVSWNCDTRVSGLSRELLVAMKNSGCLKVAFGVESGSQRVLDLVHKQIRVEQVAEAVRLTREAGIPHVEGNFIIGSDLSETLEDIEMTRELIKSVPWTFISVTVIVPYPGTQVYTSMKDRRYIDSDAAWEDFVMFGRTPKWRTDNFSSAELVRLQKRLNDDFYLRFSYIAKQLFAVRSWHDVRYWCSAGATYLRWHLTGRV